MARALWPNGQTYPGDVWHEYGPRKPIWTPNGWTSNFHGGIDIGPWNGAYNTWLLSPVDGVVIYAQYDPTFGNWVQIRGKNADFWLCHGKPGTMQVRYGDTVKQGQRIQMMGETGKASGVHLHYEVHVNGSRVDPRAYYASAAGADGSGGNSSDGESVKTKLLFKEESMEFFNIQGQSGSHNAGLFATYRKNSDGTLVAKRLTRTIVAGYPTIPNEGLVELRKAMPFIDL